MISRSSCILWITFVDIGGNVFVVQFQSVALGTPTLETIKDIFSAFYCRWLLIFGVHFLGYPLKVVGKWSLLIPIFIPDVTTKVNHFMCDFLDKKFVNFLFGFRFKAIMACLTNCLCGTLSNSFVLSWSHCNQSNHAWNVCFWSWFMADGLVPLSYRVCSILTWLARDL